MLNLGSTFLCWAFSCASMLKASCTILVNQMFDCGKISEGTKNDLLEFITEEKTHEKIRNLIAMILLPKKLHINDQSQSAYLRAAVSRVGRNNWTFVNFRLPIQQFLRNLVLWWFNLFIGYYLTSGNYVWLKTKCRSVTKNTILSIKIICNRLPMRNWPQVNKHVFYRVL